MQAPYELSDADLRYVQRVLESDAPPEDRQRARDLIVRARLSHSSAAAVAEPKCAHRIVDARNPVVKSGYLCVDCGAVFSAADHEVVHRATPEQISTAKDYTGYSDELRFDDDAEISEAEGGVWVNCWQWLPNEDEE